jgi:sigma-B regulation protein RsbQ
MREASDLNAEQRRVLTRNNVHVEGQGSRPMMFCPGLGADQTLWRSLTPYFTADWRVVTLDQVGTGDSDRSEYRWQRYETLEGYVDDILQICAALDIVDTVFVGHSIGATIGIKAANAEPARIAALIMLGASARYVNDSDYVGGFERAEIEEFLFLLQANHEPWARQMAAQLVAADDRPELADLLMNTYFKLDPVIANQFARIALFSDARRDVAACRKPALIVHCNGDMFVPLEASRSLHELMKSSQQVFIDARGHFPHLSAPAETAAVMRTFLRDPTLHLG